ncbi:purine nucleoside permease [Nocardia sp. CDC159]|uniref:Purine nucleoside permease n=1 Tax=Nocardia pulmonis TaxID=2951408 RepID=A0A9X2EAI5_9NOCA|nr:MULTISPECIES: purine nucleoside permease [Nocardia]MCM6777342.1 purine nucleoside permease [Nocardia pulmonis]MCM6790227.1 purine nucleoside permease [Nocardia sp. CDC159]
MYTRWVGALLSALGLVFVLGGCGTQAGGTDRIGVKAMVITMFDPEAEPWVKQRQWSHEIPVPGVRRPVRCNDSGLCMMVTDMGKTNAALSTSAVLASPRLDFDNAYFITAGIAGTPPEAGTLGFAAWARWVVDVDLGHHVLPQDDPGVPDGYLGMPKAGTEVYELDQRLVDAVYRNTKDVTLADSPAAAQARAAFPGQEGQKPVVTQCDTATGDNFWSGAASSAQAAAIVRTQTDGRARYCTSQMEDNATAAALARAGKLNRYVSLRTASNFDRPRPGQSVTELLTAIDTGAENPGFPLAVDNAYRVASAAADYLMAHPNLD